MLYIVHLQKNCSLDSGVPLFWIFINIGIIMKAYICIELRWKVSKGPDKCLKFKEDVCEIGDSWKQIIAVIDTAFTVAKRKPEFFFRLSFHNCKSCVYNWDDLLSYNFSLPSSHKWFFIYS